MTMALNMDLTASERYKLMEERIKKMWDLLEKIEPFTPSGDKSWARPNLCQKYFLGQCPGRNLFQASSNPSGDKAQDLLPNNNNIIPAEGTSPDTVESSDVPDTPHEDEITSIESSQQNTSRRRDLVNLDGTPVSPGILTRKHTYLDLLKLKSKSKTIPKYMFSACGPVESAVVKFPDHSADWPVLIAKDSWENIGPFICPKLSNRRGELMLHIWTDFGQVSKLSVINGAVSIREHNCDQIKLKKYIQDPGLLLQFEKFCHQLDSVLERPHRKLMSSSNNLHYRIVWIFFTIFDRTMNCTLHTYADIVDICQNGPTKYYERPSSATKIKNGSVIDSRSHVKKILSLLNPDVEHFLSHASPLRKFVIAFGRYLQIQCCEGSTHILRKNILYESIKQFYEKLSLSLLDHKTQLPYLLEALVNPACPKVSNLAFKSFVNTSHLRNSPLASKLSNKSMAKKGVKKNRPSTAPATKELTAAASRSTGTVARNLPKVEAEGTPAKRKISPKTICMYFCKYPFIRVIAEDKGFIEVDDQEQWNMIWSDTAINLEHLPSVAQLQDPKCKISQRDVPVYKMNHFPGMEAISRKDTLSKNIRRMQNLFLGEFDFIPNSWTTPNEVDQLLAYAARNKKAVYICKPNNGCQGKGISVATNLNKMIPFANATYQTYIPRPFLIEGYKFDLRIYVLVTSIEPLVIYIYPEGLARFATVPYQPPTSKNVGVKTMHLTNTSINKYHSSYTPERNKRKMTEVFQVLLASGVDMELIQASIDDVIIKTVIAAHSELLKSYHTSFPNGSPHGSICFELLGFDIILDENLKAYILETNRAPSFSSDVDIDDEFKYSVIHETFDKIYFGPISDAEEKEFVANRPTEQIKGEMKASLSDVGISKGHKKQFLHESLYGRKWRLIYPLKDTCEMYSKYLDIGSHQEELIVMPKSSQMRRGTAVRLMQQTMKPIKRPVTNGLKGKRRRRGLYSQVLPAWKVDKGNLRYRDREDAKNEKPANLHMSVKSAQIMKSAAYKDRKPIWQRPTTPSVMPERRGSTNPCNNLKNERKSEPTYTGPRLDPYYLNCPAAEFAIAIKTFGLKLNYDGVIPTKRKKTPAAKTKPKKPEPPKTLSAAEQHLLRKKQQLAKLQVIYNLPRTILLDHPVNQAVAQTSTKRGTSLPILKSPSPQPSSSTRPAQGSSKKPKHTESKTKVKKSTNAKKPPPEN